MINILNHVKEIESIIPADSMGASPVDKCFLMCQLARKLHIDTFVEIGVFKGRSLFSVASIIDENGGVSIGIDPYKKDNFIEYDCDKKISKLVNDAANSIDFNSLFLEVLERRRELNLNRSVFIIKKPSEEAVDILKEKKITIGMLHIDGNHDTKNVEFDAENYISLVKPGGIIIFDDINWHSVRKVYDKYAQKYTVIFDNDYFGIIYKNNDKTYYSDIENDDITQYYKLWLKHVYENINSIIAHKEKPKIFIGVLTYNHENYIKECIESIKYQIHDYPYEIVLIDDCSIDNTFEIAGNCFLNDVNVRLIRHTKNLGYVKGHCELHDLFRESYCDYYMCIEGDDYIISPNRIKEQIDFMEKHPECSMSFCNLLLYEENTKKFKIYDDQNSKDKEVYDLYDLISLYFIGTWSTIVLRKNAMYHIGTETLSLIKSSDWLSSLLALECGDLGHIKKPYTVYRKHNKGVWSSSDADRNNYILFKLIKEFNSLTSYRYYNNISNVSKVLLDNNLFSIDYKDLVIIDDFFPCKISGFRYIEFLGILNHFKNSLILTNGKSLKGFDDNLDIAYEIRKFKNENFDLANRIDIIDNYSCKRFFKSKLAYFCFLNNCYDSLDFVEMNDIPFVFELYPGGGMAINNCDVDKKLKRIFSSKQFKGVIVTQDTTYRYLIDKKMTDVKNIKFIFGTLISKENLMNYSKQIKINEQINICFVANKYTKYGENKGYDTFIETARVLKEKGKNYLFHVVGNYNKNDFNISGLEDSIHFHGILENSKLPLFLNKMDILISPTRVGKITKGDYDGFPTTCCTEAMLQGTLVFSSDPLNNCNNRYINNKDIVIIDNNPNKIANKVIYFDEHRSIMEELCSNQIKKTLELYDYDYQIGERIKYLESFINEERNLNENKCN